MTSPLPIIGTGGKPKLPKVFKRIEGWWRRLNCKHDWKTSYGQLVLSDGPNKGSVCGVIVEKDCSKCGAHTVRMAI